MKMSITNNFELVEMLGNEFGKRLMIDIEALLHGIVEGMLDSKRFIINFSADEYLVIYTTVANREVIDEFLPLFKKITGIEPLCSYDLLPAGMDPKEALPTVEWELDSIDNRTKEIMTGNAFEPGDSIYNLNFYDSNKILIKTAYRYKRNI